LTGFEKPIDVQSNKKEEQEKIKQVQQSYQNSDEIMRRNFQKRLIIAFYNYFKQE
jgi:hypothetical protein